jgi:hypothetical protein
MAAAAVEVAAAVDEMAHYEPVELRSGAAAELPQVSSGQEVPAAAPELLDGDHGDQNLAAAVAVAVAAQAMCRHSTRPKRAQGSRELGQQDDTSVSSLRRDGVFNFSWPHLTAHWLYPYPELTKSRPGLSFGLWRCDKISRSSW